MNDVPEWHLAHLRELKKQWGYAPGDRFGDWMLSTITREMNMQNKICSFTVIFSKGRQDVKYKFLAYDNHHCQVKSERFAVTRAVRDFVARRGLTS